jgi:hypothetical protein
MRHWRDLIVPATVLIVLMTGIGVWLAFGIDDAVFVDSCLDRGGMVEGGRCVGASAERSPLLYIALPIIGAAISLGFLALWWRRAAGKRDDA